MSREEFSTGREIDRGTLGEYGGTMKKETMVDFKVKLHADQVEKLGEIANERRVSRSQIIREAVDKFLKKK